MITYIVWWYLGAGQYASEGFVREDELADVLAKHLADGRAVMIERVQ